MGELRLRRAARGLVVDDDQNILLCCWNLKGLVVWGTPAYLAPSYSKALTCSGLGRPDQ